MNRFLALLSVAVLLSACTPKADGVCVSDSECKADESCYSGICVKKVFLDDGGSVVAPPDAGSDAGASDAGSDGGTADGGVSDGGAADAGSDAGTTDTGGSDAGPDAGASDAGPDDAGTSDAGTDAGTPDAGTPKVTIDQPASGAFVNGHVHAHALTSGPVAADSVVFDLKDASSASLGSVAGVAQAGGAYSATLDVTSASASGPVTLTATMHTSIGTVFDSIPLTLDQVSPTISSSWTGTHFEPRAGSFTVTATVGDDRQVASARLNATLAGGGSSTYLATLSGSTATFTVPAPDLAVAGQVYAAPFTLSVLDGAGNSFLTAVPSGGGSFVLRVDDQPPVVSAAADGLWHNSHATVLATVSEATGAGVDGGSVLLVSGAGAAVAPFFDGGSYSFDVNVAARVPATFEGPLPFQVLASDLVGNAADGGGAFLVDVVPPSIALLAVQTAPDLLAGRWYRASGADLAVSAQLDGGSGSPLDAGSISLAWAGGSVSGTLAGRSVTFALPRSAGAGLQSGLALVMSASDQAGNVSTAPLTVAFDDLPPSIGAVAIADGGSWVARVLPDGGTNEAISIVATDPGVGVASVQPYLANGSAPLGAAVGTPIGGPFVAAVDVSTAQAGAAASFAFSIVALDALANRSSKAVSIPVDDAAPVISQPPVDVDSSWHSGLGGSTTASIAPIITIDDQGSGVQAGPTLKLANGTPAGSAATLLSGGANHGRWKYAALAVPADSTLNGSYTFTVAASDVVGNQGSGTFSVNVDNVPPVLSGVTFTPEGNGYFRGPDAALATDADTIDVAMTLTESHPFTAVASSPGMTSVNAVLSNGLLHFAIPRSIGAAPAGQSVSKLITFTATDQAGSTGTATATLVFDDTPLSIAVAVDGAWYPGAVSVLATRSAAVPPSGLASVKLVGTGCSIDGTSADSVHYTFALPASCTPANQEGPFGFNAVVTSGSGATASGAGSRNIDKVPPTIVGASYQTQPLASGSTVLATVTALDCGSGVATPTAALSPAIASKSIASSGGGTCAQVTFTLSGDLQGTGAWTFGQVNTPISVNFAVADAVGNAPTNATQLALLSGTAGANRLLWTADAHGGTSLAVGPASGGKNTIFVSGTGGVWAIGGSQGAGQQLSGTAASLGPAVGGTYASWVQGKILRSTSATAPGAVTDCDLGVPPRNGVAGFPQTLMVGSDGNPATSLSYSALCAASDVFCPPSQRCTVAGSGDPGCKGGIFAVEFSGGCDSLTPGPAGLAGTAGTYDLYSGKVVEESLGASFFGSSRFIVMPDGTATDAIIQGVLHDFAGGTFTLGATLNITWPFGATAFGPAVIGNSSGSWVSVRFNGGQIGATIGGAASSLAPIIDQQGSAYLPKSSGNVLEVHDVVSGLSGANKLAITSSDLGGNGTISDYALDKNGVLYVIAGGTLYAFQMDSNAFASGGASRQDWSAPGRDACRSNNLTYSCPY